MSALAVVGALVCSHTAQASTVYTRTAESPLRGTGANPTATFLKGQFDGDGRTDLLLANNDGTYRTYLSLGDGRFQPVPASAPFPNTGANSPFVSGVGRFNGDALDDLALTHLNSPGITVLLATGAGGFTPAPGSPFGAGLGNGRGATVGRMNLDAFDDIVVVTTGGTLAFFFGNGSGGFNAGPTRNLGSAPLIGVGRIDGGPTTDIAYQLDNPGRTEVLLNDGGGGLTPAPGGPFPTGTTWTGLPHVSDLNADGFGDVVTSHSSNADNVVSVLLGSASGALSPAAGSPFAAGGIGPSSTDPPALLGGDPHLDVLATMTQSAGVGVLQGDGAGRLSPMAGSPFASGAPSPQSSRVADFNADGINDIAYVHSNTVDSVFIALGRRAAASDRNEMRFPVVVPGQASEGELVQIANTAPFAISFGDAAIAGPAGGDFDRSNDTCSGRVVAPSAACTIRVRFLPTTAGPRAATLTIPQDGDVVTVALSGTGAGPASPPGSPPGSPPVLTRLDLSSFTVQRSVFAVAPLRRSAAGHRRHGTTFRFAVSHAAQVRITVERATTGRRRGRSCVAPTRRNRTARRCTRHVRVGTLTRAARAGANTLAWTGRFGRRAMRPGRYRATAVASADGLTSPPRRVAFRIVRH